MQVRIGSHLNSAGLLAEIDICPPIFDVLKQNDTAIGLIGQLKIIHFHVKKINLKLEHSQYKDGMPSLSVSCRVCDSAFGFRVKTI